MFEENLPTTSQFLFYQTEDGRQCIQVKLENETVWLSQKLMAELFQKDIRTIIDFGLGIGKKKTSAQITHLYNKENLIGKQVLAVVNFPPKQVGSFMSEVFVLGLSNKHNEIVLVRPDEKVPDGEKLH